MGPVRTITTRPPPSLGEVVAFSIKFTLLVGLLLSGLEATFQGRELAMLHLSPDLLRGAGALLIVLSGYGLFELFSPPEKSHTVDWEDREVPPNNGTEEDLIPPNYLHYQTSSQLQTVDWRTEGGTRVLGKLTFISADEFAYDTDLRFLLRSIDTALQTLPANTNAQGVREKIVEIVMRGKYKVTFQGIITLAGNRRFKCTIDTRNN